MLMMQSAPEESPTDLIFLGIFVAALAQKWLSITPFKLGIQYICSIPQMPK
jgi:hypothetical protein